MKVTQLKCIKCGLIYEQGNIIGCPRCGEQVSDRVLGYISDQRPLLSIEGLLWDWPHVRGQPITGLN